MRPIPILMYHHVAPIPAGLNILRDLYVTPVAFARQMKLLRLLGYKGLSMAQAEPYLRGDKQGHVAVITFDDGYTDNLEHALPVLERYGFGATCYAVSSAPGLTNGWDAARPGAVTEKLMDADQLRQWQAAGFEVGAHTRTHARMTQCTDEQLYDEVHTCKAELEDTLGAPVKQFCYPYGDHDERAVECVRQAGFTGATTTIRGRALPGGDCLRWPRMPIRHRDGLAKLALRLLTQYEDRRSRQ